MTVKTYKAFRVVQRAESSMQFLLFVASAKDIYGWSHADSITIDREGVQRPLVESRWRQIGKFLKASRNNVIPTNVTIAFEDSLKPVKRVSDLKRTDGYFIRDLSDGCVEISFTTSVRDRAYIIDGQHRLKGMSEIDEDVKVPVCLLLSVSRLERAFQFVTINNKAHKVPTDNLKALVANFEEIEGDLKKRLRESSVPVPRLASAIDFLNEDKESPFHNLVDWVNSRDPDSKNLIAPSAIENSLRAIQRSLPDEASDEVEAKELLSEMWRRIYRACHVTFDNIQDFVNLTKKATIQSLSEMIVQKIRSDYDPAFATGPSFTTESLGAAAEQLVSGVPQWFWKDPWLLKSLDTSAGREVFKADFRVLKRGIMNHDDEQQIRELLALYRTNDED